MTTAEAPALVGRDLELDEVDRALAAVAARRGRTLAVCGDPGLGKSRLLDELDRRARAAGHLVLRGAAAEFEREVPLNVFTDALDAHLAGLDAARLRRMGVTRLDDLATLFPALAEHARAPGERLRSERYRAYRALGDLLGAVAATRPLVLLLDDVHWADEASLEALWALRRRPPAGAVLMGLAYRPVARLAGMHGAAVAAAATADDVAVLELAPLPDGEARRLVLRVAPERSAGEAEAIVREARGNPFYLEQLARLPASAIAAGDDDHLEGGFVVPAAVRASLEEELAALPRRARRLLEGAAVAGEPFDVRLAADIAPLPLDDAVEAVDAAIAAGVVRSTGVPGHFTFRHPLVRRTVYAGSGAGWRLAAHARAVTVLRERGGDGVALARHVERCAEPGDEAAIAVLEDAARATAATAPATAAHFFRAAERLLPEGERERRVALLSGLGAAVLATGDAAAALEPMSAAVALAGDDADPELVAGLAEIEQWSGRPESARRRIAGALAAAAPEDHRGRALLSMRLMMVDMWNARRDDAVAIGHAALAEAAQADDPAVLGAVQAMLGEAASHVDPVVGAALLDPSTAAARRLADDEIIFDHLFWLGWGSLHLERLEAALEIWARGERAARARGADGYWVTYLSNRAEALVRLGRAAEARAAAEEAVEATRLHGNPRLIWWATWCQSCTLLRTGDDAGAAEAFAACEELVGELTAHPLLRLWMGYQRASLASTAGDHETAIHWLQDAGGGPELPNIPPNDRQWAWEIRTRWALAQGDLDAAAVYAEDAEAWAALTGFRGGRGYAARCRAWVEEARGDLDAAIAAAEASIAAFERLPDPLNADRTRITWARCTAARGDKPAAVAALLEAEARLRAAGVERDRADAARELRRLGRRVRARAVATVDGAAPTVQHLSTREREVAALVHERHTNREIATVLFLSEKTVESHLRNIFAKLGASSRMEVAMAVERAVAQRA